MARGVRFGLPGLLLALAFALLVVGMRTPPELALDLGAPGDARFLYGFFEAEEGPDAIFRWSGPDARLLFHSATGGAAQLDLRIFGGWLADSPDPRLTLERDEHAPARFAVQPGWRIYRVLLSPGTTVDADGAAAPIRLRSDTQRPGPQDGRELGVPIDRLRLQPLPAAGIPFDAPLRRAVIYVWGLGVLAAAAGRLTRALRPDSDRLPTLAATTIAGGAAAALIIWAWRDPYALAWALPGAPWTLGLATGLLVWMPQNAADRREAPGWAPWAGLGLLVAAQSLFHAQQLIGVGIGLALAGLALLRFGDRAANAEPWQSTPVAKLDRRRALLLLGVLFLVALAFRFYRIADLPFGLWRDEARHGLVALDMMEHPGYRPIYIAGGGVNMPALGLYPFALALDLWGIHIWTMRAVPALAGALTVLPLYALTAQLTRRRDIALLAAAFLAVSSWHVTISRFSFPTVFDPLLGLTGLWLLLVGLERVEGRFGTAAGLLGLSGVCLGLAVQTYHTGRVTPVVAGILALLWLTRRPRVWRRWLFGMVALAMGMLVAMGPLIGYVLDNPDAFNDRVGQVFLLSVDAREGRAPLAMLDDALRRHLLMFNVIGDNNGRHHAPFRPLLDFVTGLGFLVGVAALLRHGRDWRSLFALSALGASLLPSALAVDAPHAMRSIGAAAFACIIAALGWAEIGRLALRLQRAANDTFWPVVAKRVAVGLVVAALGLNYWTYFVAMASNPEVWRSFYVIQTRVAIYLRDRYDAEGPQALESIYVPTGVVNHSVFAYLGHGLPVRVYDENAPPASPDDGTQFVLGGYTYREDLARLEPCLGDDPVLVVRGPDFPDSSDPSFVVYARR